MKTDDNPLFTLTVGEFMARIKDMIEEALNQKKEESANENKMDEGKDENFTIAQLCKFLGCTKATIHNYKKRGLPWFGFGKKILFRKSEVMDFLKRFASPGSKGMLKSRSV